jgi:uncharacterized protein YeaO (DUF488 family)
MKKIKVYLIGQKYEIELEDEFYDYILEDIQKLNNSQNQIKDLLNLLLSCKYKNYSNEKVIKKMLEKL